MKKEMDLKIEAPKAPDEWALNICNALGEVDEYWNPSGGLTLFDRQKYLYSGLNLRFQRVNLLSYSQRREGFEPGLSIIDIMMFNSNDEISTMLDNYELV